MWWKKSIPFLRHKTKFLSVLRILEIPWYLRKGVGVLALKNPWLSTQEYTLFYCCFNFQPRTLSLKGSMKKLKPPMKLQ